MGFVSDPIRGVVYPAEEDTARHAALGLFEAETMGDAFRAVAARYPNKHALKSLATTLTYQELDAQSDRAAARFLRAGLVPNDRVVFQLVNCPELVILLLACLKAGLIRFC